MPRCRSSRGRGGTSPARHRCARSGGSASPWPWEPSRAEPVAMLDLVQVRNVLGLLSLRVAEQPGIDQGRCGVAADVPLGSSTVAIRVPDYGATLLPGIEVVGHLGDVPVA